LSVRIEKGGWILIFLLGVSLVGYSFHRYGFLDWRRWLGPPELRRPTPSADTSKSLPPDSDLAETNEVRVRVNGRVSCAGGLVANGGLRTVPGSIYAGKGLRVSFEIIDDWSKAAARLADGSVDVMLTTVDVWARDQAQLMERDFGARAFFLAGWSRGADGVIGRQGIESLEDLAGRTIAFAPHTPSHFLLWSGLKNSGLTTKQLYEIFSKATHARDGIEAAALFAEQKVDAAVAWEPDLSDALARRPGSRRIFDTRLANRLIADILVASDRFAARNPGTLVRFIEGWLEGVEFIRAQPARAHGLIGTIKEFNIPEDLAKTMLDGVRLADYADNLAFFGTPEAPSDYANILRMAHQMYRELRLIRGSPDPEATLERRYLEALRGSFSAVSTERPIDYRLPPPGAVPIATQRRLIHFENGSARMDLDARAVADEIGSFLRACENTVVDIEGNTDSAGSREQNLALSKERAEAVKRYLVDKYGFPPGRIRTRGNGPDKPIASDATPEGRQRNRRTDIKIYANQDE
jgi:outer membrane protein OmpA-like peptidoglycan-associated protein/ABC-type nitrate/sulfonate/bicarbonate transport system substrate-binding protein